VIGKQTQVFIAHVNAVNGQKVGAEQAALRQHRHGVAAKVLARREIVEGRFVDVHGDAHAGLIGSASHGDQSLDSHAPDHADGNADVDPAIGRTVILALQCYGVRQRLLGRLDQRRWHTHRGTAVVDRACVAPAQPAVDHRLDHCLVQRRVA
jgi:hypothetical protein